jgi:SAM-dependent methyltransferase
MMGDSTHALREIPQGAVARLLLAEIQQLTEREGILDRMQRLSPFSREELCRALQSELGYSLGKGNRQRMIHLLLRLLAECGWLKEAEGVWLWDREHSRAIQPTGDPAVSAEGSPEAAADGQVLFFRECLESVPAYLRGGGPSVLFDEKSTLTWDRFLGCAEFRSCRALLLDLMGIEDRPSFRLLDLCHGPGWGLEGVISRFPAVRITALDFTEAFARTARERARCAQARHCRTGDSAPIAWVGPDRWGGFGDPFPFPDGSFEAVFFSCGDPYIPHDRRSMVYREIGRVLAPEGRLGILTRCHPDAGARHVASFWLRISALAHDFAESVCEGWEGFSDAEENIRLFSDAGFQGGVAHLGTMSFLESSLWVLKKTSSGHD